MPSTNFSTATDGSTVTFDFDQSSNWQVTLGGNRTLTLAGGQEGDVINVMLIQDSTGSRTVTWPSNVVWQSLQAPNLKAKAGAIDVITFVKRGSNWQDAGGAPSRLPSRIRDAGLGTILGVAATALTLSLSGGGGATGNNPNAVEVRNLTGAQLNTKVDGSGSVLVGSGILAVGTIDSRGAQANFIVQNSGVMSGRQLAINASAAASGKLIINGSKGSLICMTRADGTIRKVLMSGALVYNVAPVGTECNQ